MVALLHRPLLKNPLLLTQECAHLTFLINKARESYESDLKSHEKDKMLYKSKLEGLEADLKARLKHHQKISPKKTREELAEPFAKKEKNEPMPPCLRRYKTNDCTVS